jgi:hypothetical protein
MARPEVTEHGPRMTDQRSLSSRLEELHACPAHGLVKLFALAPHMVWPELELPAPPWPGSPWQALAELARPSGARGRASPPTDPAPLAGGDASPVAKRQYFAREEDHAAAEHDGQMRTPSIAGSLGTPGHDQVRKQRGGDVLRGGELGGVPAACSQRARP